MPHTPHTPHTPSGGNSSGHPMTPGGPPSVPPSSQSESNANSQSSTNTNNSSSNNKLTEEMLGSVRDPKFRPSDNSNSSNNNTNSNSNNNSNPAANIMNSPQSLLNSPQNMMNSPMQPNMMNMDKQQRYGPYGGQHHDDQINTLANLTDVDLNADLNFDPAAVIEGEGGNDLNVSLEALKVQNRSFETTK
jgi:hypothetical protein